MTWLYWLDTIFLTALVSALCWLAYLAHLADHE
jgi:hypothetical protein